MDTIHSEVQLTKMFGAEPAEGGASTDATAPPPVAVTAHKRGRPAKTANGDRSSKEIQGEIQEVIGSSARLRKTMEALITEHTAAVRREAGL